MTIKTHEAPPLAEIEDALDRVVDPCSVAAGNPLSLRSMGLIRDVTFDADTGRLAVEMVVTSPACFLSENMAAGLRQELSALRGVVDVDVRIDSDFRWSPDDISVDAQALLDSRRRDRAKGLRPQQWREAARTSD